MTLGIKAHASFIASNTTENIILTFHNLTNFKLIIHKDTEDTNFKIQWDLDHRFFKNDKVAIAETSSEKKDVGD